MVNRNRKILIVDDEEGPRESLKLILADDYDIDTAVDAESAIWKISSRSEEFAVVITDIRMTKKTGIDVLRAAKAHCDATEIIIITAYSEVETARDAIRYGAFEYLQKPFDLDNTTSTVQRAYRQYVTNKRFGKQYGDNAVTSEIDYLEIVSNELGAPMDLILAHLENLEHTDLTQVQRREIDQMKECSRRYYNNLSDVLNLSRIAIGEKTPVMCEFNPESLILRIFNELGKNARDTIQPVFLEDLPTSIIGPESELRILLRRMLRKAVLGSIGSMMHLEISYDKKCKSLSIALKEIAAAGEPITPFRLSLSKNVADKIGGTIRFTSGIGDRPGFLLEIAAQVAS